MNEKAIPSRASISPSDRPRWASPSSPDAPTEGQRVEGRGGAAQADGRERGARAVLPADVIVGGKAQGEDECPAGNQERADRHRTCAAR